MKVIEGLMAAPNARVAIVVARFNNFINDSLVNGALDVLIRQGQIKDDNITLVKVPGAIEMPLVCKKLAKTGNFDAIVALGCVIRGGTYHFDLVANQNSSSMANVMMDFEVPIAFGVLTTENIEQAIERAGTKAGNKGAEAALSALEMINVLQQLD